MENLGGLFNPSSPEMEAMADLTYYTIAISAVILGIIVISVAYIIIRYRKKADDAGEPYQNFGNLKIEIVWTVIPIAIVAVLFLLTCNTMRAVDPRGDREPDLIIIGHQWWWELRYPSSGVLTANEVHIPVGREMLVRLESIDVIHDFWVPELGRKIDLVPGHPNYIWLVAGSRECISAHAQSSAATSTPTCEYASSPSRKKNSGNGRKSSLPYRSPPDAASRAREPGFSRPWRA